MTATLKVRIYTPEQRRRAVIRATAWAEAHPERRKQIESKYRKSDKGKSTILLASQTPIARLRQKRWRVINKDRKNKATKRWGKINRESIRRTHRQHVKKAWGGLRDYMIRAYLKQRGVKQPTQQEIEICRQRIQLKRMARVAKLQDAAQRLSKALLPSAAQSSIAR
jgi:hypothetical protein